MILIYTINNTVCSITIIFFFQMNLQIQNNDYQGVFQDISNIINKYSQDFCHKFNKMEAALILQLQERVKILKNQITELKRQTSNQQLQKNINEEKQEKQAHRVHLQMQWREITQRLKKMEKQHKQINNWNRQAEFDITNLKSKIEEIKIANSQLTENVAELTQKKNSDLFLTDNISLHAQHNFKNRPKRQNTNYSSSYKGSTKYGSNFQNNEMSIELYELLSNRKIKKKIFDILNQ